MTSFYDHAVQAVHDTYDKLPNKYKATDLDERSVGEWVPLSGIVLYKGKRASNPDLTYAY